MVTNTMVLIVVAAFATLVLASVLVLVAYKTRTQEALADEFDARAHAAQVEIDIKTTQASSLQHQATAYRSEAVTSRDQLNEPRVHRLAG